jgi:hypothetical protein
MYLKAECIESGFAILWHSGMLSAMSLRFDQVMLHWWHYLQALRHPYFKELRDQEKRLRAAMQPDLTGSYLAM